GRGSQWVAVDVELGSAYLTARELEQLSRGDIVCLPGQDRHVLVKLDGRPAFWAQPCHVRRRMAVRMVSRCPEGADCGGVPRDHVLRRERLRALWPGRADGEPQGGVELLRELVHLVLTAVVQQPALGLPPTQRLQVTEMVPESFESWRGRAQQAPAWAA